MESNKFLPNQSTYVSKLTTSSFSHTFPILRDTTTTLSQVVILFGLFRSRLSIRRRE